MRPAVVTKRGGWGLFAPRERARTHVADAERETTRSPRPPAVAARIECFISPRLSHTTAAPRTRRDRARMRRARGRRNAAREGGRRPHSPRRRRPSRISLHYASHHVTSHHITSHHITLHNITLHTNLANADHLARALVEPREREPGRVVGVRPHAERIAHVAAQHTQFLRGRSSGASVASPSSGPGRVKEEQKKHSTHREIERPTERHTHAPHR